MNLNRLKPFSLILTILLSTTSSVLAQSDYDQIISDRSHFTQSPFTIPRGKLQFEFGYRRAYLESSITQITDHFVPDVIVRYGFNNRMEFNLGWSIVRNYTHGSIFQSDPRTFEISRNYRLGPTTNSTDMKLGIKLSLSSNHINASTLSLLFEVKLPLGHSDNDYFETDFGLSYIFRFLGSSYFTGSTSINATINEDLPYSITQATSINIPLEDHLSLYVEASLSRFLNYSVITSQPAGQAISVRTAKGELLVNSGMIFSYDRNTQLTLTLGQEINSLYYKNYFASIGVAYQP